MSGAAVEAVQLMLVGPLLQLVQRQAAVILQEVEQQRFDDLPMSQVGMAANGTVLINDPSQANLAQQRQNEGEGGGQAPGPSSAAAG